MAGLNLEMMARRQIFRAREKVMGAPFPGEGEPTLRQRYAREFDARTAGLERDPRFNPRRLPFATRLSDMTPDNFTQLATFFGVPLLDILAGVGRERTLVLPGTNSDRSITFYSLHSLGDENNPRPPHSALLRTGKAPNTKYIPFRGTHAAVVMGPDSFSFIERETSPSLVSPDYFVVSLGYDIPVTQQTTVVNEDILLTTPRYEDRRLEFAKAIEVLNSPRES